MNRAYMEVNIWYIVSYNVLPDSNLILMSLMTLCLYVSRPHKNELLILYEGSGCTGVHPYNLLVNNVLDGI